MQEIQVHKVLNPTNVGSNLRLDAQINAREVNRVKKYSHHKETPKINPGTIITPFANHERNSTVL
jgi:hypothetical protein